MANRKKLSRASNKIQYLKRFKRTKKVIRTGHLSEITNKILENGDVGGSKDDYITLETVIAPSNTNIDAESCNIHEAFNESKDAIEGMTEENHVLMPQRVYVNKNKNKKTIKRQRRLINKERSENIQKQDGGEERRIVDINYFISELQAITNHSPLGCSFANLVTKYEKKTGLMSKLTFECNLCRANFTVNTCDPKPKNTVDVNTAAVSGTTAAGIGYSQLSELLSAMNIPPMTKQTYVVTNKKVSIEWEKTAILAMEAAAERERQAAIKEGRVKDGIAIIDVIADGCWSKRSYKTNYSALSGAAAIIGRKYGEVLYLGVKNKYCCICARAENKGTSPKEHLCYKNYTGSSTGMEAEIIAEGFKCSIEMHNLIYGRLIADGDSSTYFKIRDSRPYPNHSVEKIECRNHLLRNLCNKLVALTKNTAYHLNTRRMITTSRILAIRKAICLSIAENKKDTKELSVRVNQLHNDISNSYSHAFGKHDECKAYYCESEKKSEDLTEKLVGTAIWMKLQYHVRNVAKNARSLINDVDSNRVECFNSIVAKLVGGKRINYSLRKEYQTRASAAVVSFNTKSPVYTLHKNMIGRSPKSKSKAHEEKRIKKSAMCNNYTRRKLYFKPQSADNAKDKSYGDECQKPDVAPEEMTLLKENFLKSLTKTQEQRQRIEKDTILQRDNSEWLELRRQLVTASNFGKIIKKRETTGPSIVKALLYSKNLSNVKAIKHGVENEGAALTQLSAQLGITIQPCGLFLDEEIPYIGATPDGLVGDDQIVEIKCPISVFNQNLLDIEIKKKLPFYKMKNGAMVVNKTHNWYYQVQGQLHVTKKEKCIFAIWSGENHPLLVEIIHRDDEFWKKCMAEKLQKFYLDHVLPELVDPRHTRNLPLRSPVHIKTVEQKRKTSQELSVPYENSNSTLLTKKKKSELHQDKEFVLSFEEL